MATTIINNILTAQIKLRDNVSIERSNLCEKPLSSFKSNEDRKTQFKKLDEKKDSYLFVMTWQDTMTNFNKVYDNVLLKFGEKNIIARKIGTIGKKNRRDIYIHTTDNLKFKTIFYETLKEMQEKNK